MDFADFSNPDDTLRQRSIESYKNWGHAYAQVVVWNTLLKVALAVPVASYLQAFNSAGVYHPEDESWVWIYGFKLNGIAGVQTFRMLPVLNESLIAPTTVGSPYDQRPYGFASRQKSAWMDDEFRVADKLLYKKKLL